MDYYDSELPYSSLVQSFQSLFKKANKVDLESMEDSKHDSVYKDNSGIVICSLCKTELESMDYSQQEWGYNISAVRCDMRRSSSPKGVRTAFEKYKLNVSPMMMDIIEAKYRKILQSECNKVFRGQNRDSVVASCLFSYIPRIW